MTTIEKLKMKEKHKKILDDEMAIQGNLVMQLLSANLDPSCIEEMYEPSTREYRAKRQLEFENIMNMTRSFKKGDRFEGWMEGLLKGVDVGKGLGKIIGKLETQLEVAEQLLAEKKDVTYIAKLTELSMHRIEELQES